jgi:hypothetical protein
VLVLWSGIRGRGFLACQRPSSWMNTKGLLALSGVTKSEVVSSEVADGGLASGSFHNCWSGREFQLAGVFEPFSRRGVVDKWWSQSQTSTLEARPCTTGNTASR